MQCTTRIVHINVVLVLFLHLAIAERERFRRQALPSNHVQVHSFNSNVSVTDVVTVVSSESRVDLTETRLNSSIWAMLSNVSFDSFDTFVNYTGVNVESYTQLESAQIHTQGQDVEYSMRTNRTSNGHSVIRNDLSGNVNISVNDNGMQVEASMGRLANITANTWQTNEDKKMNVFSNVTGNNTNERSLILSAVDQTYNVEALLIGARIRSLYGDVTLDIDPDYRTVRVGTESHTLVLRTVRSPFEIEMTGDLLAITCADEQTRAVVEKNSSNININALQHSLLQVFRGGGTILLGGSNASAEAVNVTSMALQMLLSSSREMLAQSNQSYISMITNTTKAAFTAATSDLRVFGGVPRMLLETGNITIEMDTNEATTAPPTLFPPFTSRPDRFDNIGPPEYRSSGISFSNPIGGGNDDVTRVPNTVTRDATMREETTQNLESNEDETVGYRTTSFPTVSPFTAMMTTLNSIQTPRTIIPVGVGLPSGFPVTSTTTLSPGGSRTLSIALTTSASVSGSSSTPTTQASTSTQQVTTSRVISGAGGSWGDEGTSLSSSASVGGLTPVGGGATGTTTISATTNSPTTLRVNLTSPSLGGPSPLVPTTIPSQQITNSLGQTTSARPGQMTSIRPGQVTTVRPGQQATTRRIVWMTMPTSTIPSARPGASFPSVSPTGQGPPSQSTRLFTVPASRSTGFTSPLGSGTTIRPSSTRTTVIGIPTTRPSLPGFTGTTTSRNPPGVGGPLGQLTTAPRLNDQTTRVTVSLGGPGAGASGTTTQLTGSTRAVNMTSIRPVTIIPPGNAGAGATTRPLIGQSTTRPATSGTNVSTTLDTFIIGQFDTLPPPVNLSIMATISNVELPTLAPTAQALLTPLALNTQEQRAEQLRMRMRVPRDLNVQSDAFKNNITRSLRLAVKKKISDDSNNKDRRRRNIVERPMEVNITDVHRDNEDAVAQFSVTAQDIQDWSTLLDSMNEIGAMSKSMRFLVLERVTEVPVEKTSPWLFVAFAVLAVVVIVFLIYATYKMMNSKLAPRIFFCSSKHRVADSYSNTYREDGH